MEKKFNLFIIYIYSYFLTYFNNKYIYIIFFKYLTLNGSSYVFSFFFIFWYSRSSILVCTNTSSCFLFFVLQIFFRAGALERLESQRDEKLTGHIILLQARCRGYLARRKLNTLKVNIFFLIFFLSFFQNLILFEFGIFFFFLFTFV